VAAPPEEIAMIRLLMQFSACFALGLVVAGMLLVGLMFFGQFDLIHGLNLSGRPLAGVALALLPGGFWDGLTGVPDAAGNASVQSFLQLCVALAQIALLLAAGFFRLWYRT
jgi:hypothetical protein